MRVSDGIVQLSCLMTLSGPFVKSQLLNPGSDIDGLRGQNGQISVNCTVPFCGSAQPLSSVRLPKPALGLLLSHDRPSDESGQANERHD